MVTPAARPSGIMPVLQFGVTGVLKYYCSYSSTVTITGSLSRWHRDAAVRPVTVRARAGARRLAPVRPGDSESESPARADSGLRQPRGPARGQWFAVHCTPVPLAA